MPVGRLVGVTSNKQQIVYSGFRGSCKTPTVNRQPEVHIPNTYIVYNTHYVWRFWCVARLSQTAVPSTVAAQKMAYIRVYRMQTLHVQ